MQTPTLDDQRVDRVFRLLRRSMGRHGRNVGFPNNTDPRKTYSWRYLQNFVERMDVMGLDETVYQPMIDAIVKYAHDHKLLSRGVAVLAKQEILDLCRAKLETEVEERVAILRNVSGSHEFLLEKAKGSNILDVLIKRPNRYAYSNIIGWLDAGSLSLAYIAVSKTCRRAMRSLQPDELNRLPSRTELHKMRLMLISDSMLLPELRRLLGNDLFEE